MYTVLLKPIIYHLNIGIIHYTLYTDSVTLYNVLYTVYSVQCVIQVYNVQHKYTMYIMLTYIYV